MFQHPSYMSQLEFDKAVKCVRELESTGTSGEPIERLRLLCLSQGATGILDLGRMFRRMVQDGKKNLNEKEFLTGLRETGIHMTYQEVKDIFDKFDPNNTGAINIYEFLLAVRPPMSHARRHIIEKAFTKMDTAGDGEITIEELKNIYNVQSHPLYVPGEKTEEQLFERFLSHFDTNATREGYITREEFFDFYSAVSASIEDDGYFDLMMRQCYRLPKLTNPQRYTSILDSEMKWRSNEELEDSEISLNPIDRLRVVCLSHGTAGILNFSRMLRRLDADGNDQLNKEEFLLGLRETGIEITEEEAKVMFQKFDPHNTGNISIYEFLAEVRPPMLHARRHIIEKAFTKMDTAGDGEITIDQLKNIYNVQSHPLYLSGEKTEEQLFKRFLSHFNINATRQGYITREEFFDFYSAVSASIEDDGYFDLMMRQCYRLPKLTNPQRYTSRLDSEMTSRSNEELEDSDTSLNPIERLRLVCLSHGTEGILNLSRMLRRMDTDGNNQLNKGEFLLGLRETGIEITKEEAKIMFQKFDPHNTDKINIYEFLTEIRPPMTDYRKKLVEKAFDKMDKAGDGEITTNILKRVYNVQNHPLYRSGEKSEKIISERFLANFEQDATKDGYITRDEFLDYYSAISASIDNDGYFDLMMRQCYKL